MSALFELLFCPMHGIFRPDNIQALLVVTNNLSANVIFWMAKLGLT